VGLWCQEKCAHLWAPLAQVLPLTMLSLFLALEVHVKCYGLGCHCIRLDPRSGCPQLQLEEINYNNRAGQSPDVLQSCSKLLEFIMSGRGPAWLLSHLQLAFIRIWIAIKAFGFSYGMKGVGPLATLKDASHGQAGCKGNQILQGPCGNCSSAEHLSDLKPTSICRHHRGRPSMPAS
jgi:hypothetical protein